MRASKRETVYSFFLLSLQVSFYAYLFIDLLPLFSLYFPFFPALWAGWRFNPPLFWEKCLKEKPEVGFVASLLTALQRVQWCSDTI